MRKASGIVRHPCFWMVFVALVIRLGVMCFVYQWQLSPDHGYWGFGFEEGRVAQAIASGQGFSNPLYGPTGPTAWCTPIYPYILAGFYKTFGPYTKASCLAILSFNSLVSSLTCLPIFFFARKSFSLGVAKVAGWIWVFFPDAVYPPLDRIWDTWLATLLLAILFFVLLKLENSNRVAAWIGFGLLSGIAALTSSVLLSVLPVLALWMIYRLHQQHMRWFAPALGAVLAVIFVVSPWFVRNYRVFHEFIPFRDCLGLALYEGNNGETMLPYSLKYGPWTPWNDDTQWREFQRLGEVAYLSQKGREGMTYIKSHPFWYAMMVGRRVVYMWTNFWSFSKRYRESDPAAPITVPLYTLLSVLTLAGLWHAFRQEGILVAMPYFIVLFFFPLIYYFTHPEWWYRRPIDPFFVVLAAYAITSRLRPISPSAARS